MVRLVRRVPPVFAGILALISAASAWAQTPAKPTPEDSAKQAAIEEASREASKGSTYFQWSKDSKFLDYWADNKRMRFDLAGKQAIPDERPQERGNSRTTRRYPVRGRQWDFALSPDSARMAFYKDRNLWIGDSAGANAVQITTDGDEKTRVKNGTGTWVYGEELYQNTAMWWSPTGRKVAFYRFDESKLSDYYLALDQKQIHSKLSVEAYPKAGDPNPHVEVLVYDLDTKKTTKLDIRNGKPFEDDVVGYYAYAVGWTADGREVTMSRMNRLQKVMEFTACNPDTGACRVIVHEEWPTGWVDQRPSITYLKDNNRFIWRSARTGFHNLYLYDMSGKLLRTLTRNAFDGAYVNRVDETKGVVYYTTLSGANHMLYQMHRVGLDGRGDKRITDPTLSHQITFSPDGKFYLDVAQSHDRPASAAVYNLDGRLVAEVAKGDASKMWALGFRPVEMFTFKAADDTTTLYGMLRFPRNFDSTKKYPIILSVYAGPETNGAQEYFSAGGGMGGEREPYLSVSLDSRSAGSRGRRFVDAIYGKLGTVEVDDQAAGIKALLARSYVDATRVGITGSSYGGYVSIMAILRYPEIFTAAYAGSPVTDWRNYDTIYTERYMGLPSANAAGYDAGSAMTYAGNLRGRLLICYGTADDNVHPSNTLQLADAFKKAGKTFQLSVDTDAGHGANCTENTMDYLIGK